MLLQIAAKHEEKNEWDRAAASSMFVGEFAGVLCRAAEKGQLTGALVAQAPMLGMDAWAAASRLLATQLEEKCFYHQAVAQLLACHQVIDAIAVYRRASLWRDALWLARARLASDSPVLSNLWLEWGRVLQGRRHATLAAQCFLRAGAPQNAVDVLFREAMGPSNNALSSSSLPMLRAGLALSRVQNLQVQASAALHTASLLLLQVQEILKSRLYSHFI